MKLIHFSRFIVLKTQIIKKRMNFPPQTSRCGTTNLGASIREGIYETENVKFSLYGINSGLRKFRRKGVKSDDGSR